MKRIGWLLALAALVPSLGLAQANRPPSQRTGPLTITGPGTTGDLSLTTATPNAGAAANTLAKLLADRPTAANPVFGGLVQAPTMQLGGPDGVAPTVAGLGYQLYGRRYATGTAPGGVNLNLLNVEGDTAAAGPQSFINVLALQNAAFGGANAVGGRQGLQAQIRQTSPTSNNNDNRNYVGVLGFANTVTGDGGKGLGGPNGNNGGGPILAGQAAGGYFGGNFGFILEGLPFNGDLAAGSKTVSNVASINFPALAVGQFVRIVGNTPGIPEAAFIDSLNPSGNSFTITQAATITQTGVPLGASKAQYVLNASGLEINPAAQAGSSVFYKSGIQISKLGSDRAQGYDTDAALAVSDQPGAITWKDGLLFGAMNGQFAISPTGYLLRSTGGPVDVSISAQGVYKSGALAGGGVRPVWADATGALTSTGPTATPTTSTSPGSRGQIAYDNFYVYICIDTNTWRRASVSAF